MGIGPTEGGTPHGSWKRWLTEQHSVNQPPARFHSWGRDPPEPKISDSPKTQPAVGEPPKPPVAFKGNLKGDFKGNLKGAKGNLKGGFL